MWDTIGEGAGSQALWFFQNKPLKTIYYLNNLKNTFKYLRKAVKTLHFCLKALLLNLWLWRFGICKSLCLLKQYFFLDTWWVFFLKCVTHCGHFWKPISLVEIFHLRNYFNPTDKMVNSWRQWAFLDENNRLITMNAGEILTFILGMLLVVIYSFFHLTFHIFMWR